MAAAADRYFQLIEATLREGLRGFAVPTDVEAGSFAMAWMLPFASDRVDIDCSPDLRTAFEAARPMLSEPSIRFVDGSGQSRSIYRALALRNLRSMSGPLMTSSTDEETSAALVSRTSAIHRFVENQQPDGTFFPKSKGDAPEPRWYDELVVLHALHCAASETGDPTIVAAVRRAVSYHAQETQPDHASSQPWAIAAFLENDSAIPLADMMLHAAGVQQPSAMDAVSLLLLVDALDCGRRRASR